MLIPREHGAYGQLLFPLVTALGVGPVSAAACGFAVAAAGGFLAHEGLAVLFGRRGSRAMREQRHAAIGSAAAFGGLGLIAGVFAFGVAPLEARYAALGTVVLAAAVMALMRAGRERTVAGELLVAITLASWCLPVGLAAGFEPSQAVSCWAVWTVTFVVATLGVRGVIARTRRERWRPLSVGAVLVGALAWWIVHRLALSGAVAGEVPLGLAPAGVLSFALWLLPVQARHLHRVGWTIAATGAVTLALLLRAL